MDAFLELQNLYNPSTGVVQTIETPVSHTEPSNRFAAAEIAGSSRLDYESAVRTWITATADGGASLIPLADPNHPARSGFSRVWLSASMFGASKRIDATVYALAKYEFTEGAAREKGSRPIKLGTFHLISGSSEGKASSGYYDAATCEVAPTNALFAFQRTDMVRFTGAQAAGAVVGGVLGAWALLVVWNSATGTVPDSFRPQWAGLV